MKKRNKIIILIVLYFLALGVRIYWFTQKNGFHVDEGMALALSCYKDYIIQKNYKFGREYTGKEVKDISLVSEAGLGEAFKDIANLWKDNRDTPHTNLYYTLFRISLINLKTSDIKPIILRGAILNLILFSVSFFVFYLLLKKIFPAYPTLQFTALICAFLSSAAISNTVFLRMYQIQETMFILFCFYFVKTFDLQKFAFNNEDKYISNSFFPLSLITAVTLMTGYFSVIFIALFGLYVITVKILKKKPAEIPFYFLVLFLAVIFAQALYLKFFSGFISYRATETTRTVFANMRENLTISVITAGKLIYTHFFNLAAIVVCVLCSVYLVIYRKKISAKRHTLFIFTAALLYFVITLIIAPYKIIRYGMPVFPFFVILPAVLIKSMTTKSRRISFAAMILLCCCFLPGAVNKNKIEYLFHNKPDEYIFAKDKNTPVCVFLPYFAEWDYAATWKFGNLIPYLNDEQKYYFYGDFDDVFSMPHEEFYLVTENYWEAENLDFSEFEIFEESVLTGGEPETMEPYFFCKKVRFKSAG